MVKHLTRNPKIEGLNLFTGTRREKTARIKVFIKLLIGCSTMVECLAHNLKIEGSNPATYTKRKKNGDKKVNTNTG